MTKNIWVISDTHFYHKNIIEYCKRPFASVQEMNEALIENWNSVVRTDDVVYHLGDVFFTKDGGRQLHRLNGRKRLILGNHDNPLDPQITEAFEKIMMWRLFPDLRILMTHVPIHLGEIVSNHSEERRGKFDVNVHGHLHDRSVELTTGVKDRRYRCVSVEHIDYTPIHIEELRP